MVLFELDLFCSISSEEYWAFRVHHDGKPAQKAEAAAAMADSDLATELFGIWSGCGQRGNVSSVGN
jgi:hypothetical protein